jgi:hypothetical protein
MVRTSPMVKWSFALLALSLLDAPLWAQTLNVTVVQSPSAPLPDISCDDDLPLVYTASYDNPFDSSSPCSLTGVSWTWSYSSVSLGGSAPPVDSFGMVVSQPSPGAAEYDVTFTPHAAGVWAWTVTASVTATNTCGGGTASGSGSLITSVTTVGVPDMFTIETHPNSAVAWPRPNAYVLLPTSVQVLKGWKIRYTAPAGYTNVTWNTPNAQFGAGSPYEHTETATGTWVVTMKGTSGGKAKTLGPRTVVVSDVEADSFIIASNGTYKRIANNVITPPANTPTDTAVKFSGRVRVKATLPALTDFKWGYAQSLGGSRVCVRTASNFAWDPLSPDGTIVSRISSVSDKGNAAIVAPITPAGAIPAGTCDQLAAGVLLYAGQNWALNATGSTDDTPSSPNPVIWTPQVTNAPDLKNVTITYQAPRTTYGLNFQTWIVAYHDTTKQYVPLRQLPWDLTFDSNNAAIWPYSANTAGAEVVPAAALPDPGAANSIVPFNATYATGANVDSKK